MRSVVKTLINKSLELWVERPHRTTLAELFHRPGGCAECEHSSGGATASSTGRGARTAVLLRGEFLLICLVYISSSSFSTVYSIQYIQKRICICHMFRLFISFFKFIKRTKTRLRMLMLLCACSLSDCLLTHSD